MRHAMGVGCPFLPDMLSMAIETALFDSGRARTCDLSGEGRRRGAATGPGD